jgi:hypothetical protein
MKNGFLLADLKIFKKINEEEKEKNQSQPDAIKLEQLS